MGFYSYYTIVLPWEQNGGIFMNCDDEFVVKVIGKISLEFPGIDQLKLRDILEKSLYGYNITSKEKSLVASDIEEKVILYIAVKKLDGLSKRTLDSYKLHLLRFSKYIHKPIRTIDTMDIRMYLSIVTKGLKNSTLANEISILKSFFKWLVQEEIIYKNPCDRIKQPKVEKRLRKSLNIEELEILKESCKTLRERALIEIFYATGCRLEEIEKLNRNDINWQDLSVHVIGKGDKERIVYISPKAKIHIKKYLLSRTDNCEALFVTTKRIHRLGRRSIEREFNKIGKRCGFTKSIFPHLIRHTTATLLLNNGADIVTVQKILGHTSPATTEGIYAEATNEHIKEEYRKHLIQ